MRFHQWVPVIVLASVASACAGAATSAVTPSATEQAFPTRTPTVTPLPTETAAPSPTSTPLPAWCPLPSPAIKTDPGELQIAFIGSGHAWVWAEAGGLASLAESKDGFDAPSINWIGFSDDGAYVAWTVVRPAYQVELWAQRLEAGEAIRLITPEWFSSMGKHPSKIVIPEDLHWVPGTHTIGFHTNLMIPMNAFVYTPDNLWWINVDTGKALPKKVDGEIFYSPDGAFAAGVNQRNAFLMNADASGQRIIPVEKYHKYQYGATYAQPPRVHWAADSHSFFLISPDAGNPVDANPLVTIYQVRVEDPAAKPFAVLNVGDGSVYFSPDHQWVAIKRSDRSTDNRSELFLARADGSQEVFYSKINGMSSVEWSPDSTRFIFWDGYQPYLGNMCAEPAALMQVLPSALNGNTRLSEFGAVWLDQTRYLLVPGSYSEKSLYLGDSADLGTPPHPMLPDCCMTFDWRLIPD